MQFTFIRGESSYAVRLRKLFCILTDGSAFGRIFTQFTSKLERRRLPPSGGAVEIRVH
jgi:hypothetical protein